MDLQSARIALEQEANAILVAAGRLQEQHATAIQWIYKCKGRVVTCGVGKSGHIARKTAGTLSSTGTPSLFLHASEAVHGDLGMVTANDIVLMYSHSGETDELVKLFTPIRAIGARTILITGRPESTCGRLADLAVTTFVTEEACPNNLAPTTSTTVMLALSDAIAISVMNLRKFSPEDFAKFHPSGSLGKRLLLRVGEVMRKGADMAVVQPATPAIDVMHAITKAGAGVACVATTEGALLGIVTDGDLRRHFIQSPTPFEAIASEIMTPNPATIEPTMAAIDALEYLQNLEKKLGELPVVEDGLLVGVLVLKDLLRSGII